MSQEGCCTKRGAPNARSSADSDMAFRHRGHGEHERMSSVCSFVPDPTLCTGSYVIQNSRVSADRGEKRFCAVCA
jgi:hypothetical protein